MLASDFEFKHLLERNANACNSMLKSYKIKKYYVLKHHLGRYKSSLEWKHKLHIVQ